MGKRLLGRVGWGVDIYVVGTGEELRERGGWVGGWMDGWMIRDASWNATPTRLENIHSNL